jgi:hypothetical protein
MAKPNMIPNNGNGVNGNAAEQSAEYGMIFTVLRQDCPDEAILLIDGTGSGKSTAIRQMLGQVQKCGRGEDGKTFLRENLLKAIWTSWYAAGTDPKYPLRTTTSSLHFVEGCTTRKTELQSRTAEHDLIEAQSQDEDGDELWAG